ncbi:MAG: NAD(P)H-dependent oxidoreductase [Desulfovibrionaceae bacterium]|nr:NAD(P)H-dependent oxidoreductase [Desulfovibrionaceae bacterium]
MSGAYTILGIAGSLRVASTNKGLLRCAQIQAPRDLHVAIADISDVPFYNADIQGHPPAAARVLEQMAKADAFLLACTEYNYSMAPALKNILDWASRLPDNSALEGKPAGIIGAGGGMGTSRAQHHLRQTCVYLNLHVMNKPEFLANAFAGDFDAEGNLTADSGIQKIADYMTAFSKWVALHRKTKD